MTENDKHYLNVAIECYLYDILTELNKSQYEDKENIKTEIINNFIERFKRSFDSMTEEEVSRLPKEHLIKHDLLKGDLDNKKIDDGEER